METRVAFQDDLIAALATPLAESALAVIRTSGAGCIEAAARCSSSPRRILDAPGNALVFGYVVDPKTMERIDQVVFGVYRAPKSYTGEDAVEIICHGSVPGIDRILQVLFSNGFRQAAGGEFTLRAFLGGKIDLSRAEAVREIVAARTHTAQSMALRRLDGSIERRVNELKSGLVKVMAAVSIQLDYDEDETGGIDIDLTSIDRIAEALLDLSETYRTGRLYQEGIAVAIAGRTNAGKSSLFNLFLKEDRAIVSDIHGTTRDYIEAPAAVGGIPVRLFDTAGLREIDEEIEREGIARTGRVIGRADLIIYIVDARVGTTGEDEAAAAGFGGCPVVKVWNKTDLPDARPRPDGWIGLSTRTGAGFRELEAAVSAAVGAGAGAVRVSESDDVIIDSPRQKRCLDEAREALARVLEGLRSGVPLDAVALDLQTALSALGEITGEVTREDILDAMFSGFCVGK